MVRNKEYVISIIIGNVWLSRLIRIYIKIRLTLLGQLPCGSLVTQSVILYYISIFTISLKILKISTHRNFSDDLCIVKKFSVGCILN